MPHHLQRIVIYTLLYLWSSSALAGEALASSGSDPFSTETMLPPRPVLSLKNEADNPCVQAAPNVTLNLLDVVSLALCNNPQTREVWASSRVYAAQLGASKAAYLPNVDINAAANRNQTGSASAVNQRNVTLTLAYLLYDFGSRAANQENARQLLLAANATQDSTVQTVFLTAVQSYYQVQATIAALEAAIESEHATKESFSAAEARYIAGSATPADKLQARTAYSQATLNRITANGKLKIAQGTLASMIGLNANQQVPLVAGVGYPTVKRNMLNNPPPNPLDETTSHSTKLPNTAAKSLVIPQAGRAERGGRSRANDASQEGEALKIFERDVDELIAEALRRRPDLQAAAAQVKAAEASADAARAADRPTVSLSASTGQSNSAGTASRGSSIGINLNVPIFSGYAPTYRVRAAEAQIEARNAQLERTRLQVALDVWAAYQNLTTATQSLRSSDDLLNSAEQSERAVLARYKAGVGNMLDVLNAQSALASARQQRIQSTFSWNVGRAVLAQAMGSLDGSMLQTMSVSGEPQPNQNLQPAASSLPGSSLPNSTLPSSP